MAKDVPDNEIFYTKIIHCKCAINVWIHFKRISRERRQYRNPVKLYVLYFGFLVRQKISGLKIFFYFIRKVCAIWTYLIDKLEQPARQLNQMGGSNHQRNRCETYGK